MTPAELKAKWIEELRSGRIAQFWRMMWSADGARCCLGVASDIAGLETIRAPYRDVMDTFSMSLKVQDLLINMNDQQRKTFPEIADWVETHDLQTGELL